MPGPVIPFENPDQEERLKKEALRALADSINRGERQRARWPKDLKEGMSELANLFPSMRGIPGTNPWDVAKLIHWMNGGGPTSASWCAGLFLLGVWNPETDWRKEGLKVKPGRGKFDVFRAMGCWDWQHVEAFQQWVANPFWP